MAETVAGGSGGFILIYLSIFSLYHGHLERFEMTHFEIFYIN